MSLGFPRNLVFEAYMPSLGWVDLTTYLSQTTNVTITRGRHGEQAKPAPTTLTCRLDDRTGNMTPGNPEGVFYGPWGQYTPVRLMLEVARASFTQVAVDQWPALDTGEAWSYFSTSAEFDSAAGVGTITIAAGNTIKSAFLAAPVLTDFEIVCDVALTVPAGTANSISILFRGVSTTSFGRVTLSVTSGGALTLQIQDRAGLVMGTASVGTWVAGMYQLRVQVEGDAVRAKVRHMSAVEPFAWQVEETVDHFVFEMNPTGWVGVRATSGTAGSLVATVDNLTARLIRFYGEASEFRPDWDESHRIRTVEFVAADLTRRMGKASARRATSAIQRYVENNAIQPVAYWPLDDGQLSNTSKVISTSVYARDAYMFDGNDPSRTPVRSFGTGSLAPWLRNTAEVKNNLNLGYPLHIEDTGAIPASSSFTAHTLIRYDGRYTDPGHTDGFYVGFGPLSWTVTFKSQSYEIDLAGPNGPSVGSLTSVPFYDGNAHHLGLRASQNGAAVDWVLYIDGAVAISGSVAATTNPTIEALAFSQNAGTENTQSRILGHGIIYAGNGPPVAEIYGAMRGHSGEPAGLRAQRICAEEGIPFTYVGNLSDTEPMGPQFQDTVLRILDECAATDRATLISSRMSAGFVFHIYRSLTQDAAVVLDYAAGHVARPFRPIRDDKDVQNLVTVRRRAGGERVVEQATGPFNTEDPGLDPEAAGINDAAVDVNTADESQLLALGQRVVAQGTVLGDRFPSVRVNLRAPEVDATQQLAVLGVDADDRVVVVNAAAAKVFDAADQLARGYTEVFRHVRAHEIIFDGVPYAPYRTFVLDTDRLDTDSSTLAVGKAAGLALPYTLSVATAAGGPLWTTDGAQFPLDVVIAGQRLTISTISGAASPQTFTVSARANGVDKAQLAGAKVSLAAPSVLG